MEEMGMDERARVFAFSTGSSRVPAGGFAALQPRFKLTIQGRGDAQLPHSHTCANQLVVPQYSSKAVLKSKLETICRHGFGFGYA